MLNFTVGPVMSAAEVLEIASYSTPYFRTPEFSAIMLENERFLLEFLSAPNGSKCVFLTTSGTGAMESCVMNILNERDNVIIINGGGFGQRFVDLCNLHKRKYTEVKVDFGCQVRKGQLEVLCDKGYTALLVNMHETSSGVLYDMEMISEFCERNKILLIIDAISAFIADELDMSDLGAAVVITSSQKAMAVQPGISIIAMAPEALSRVEENKENCMYLSLKEALKNGERGQSPFTPAVTTLLQINKRLRMISEQGGILTERKKIVEIADEFRKKIKELPLQIVSESMSNAVTALHPLNVSAQEVVRILKDEYKIWVCPNGGKQCTEIFRVGHIGYITKEDNQRLIDSFVDMKNRGLL